MPRISFCTPCMGRRHHLEATVANNLAVLSPFGPDAELVVLDYNSRDGLGEWICTSFANELDSGRLRYFRTEEPTQYSQSHAKNLSHRLSTGEILFNLDGDNFIGEGLFEALRARFDEQPRTIASVSPRANKAGRVAIRRVDWEALGGYDERFVGWGLEDKDFKMRAREGLGLAFFDISAFGHAIKHGDDERAENTESSEEPLRPEDWRHLPARLRHIAERWMAPRDPRLGRQWLANAERYAARHANGLVVCAHPPGAFGRGRVVDHRGVAREL